MIKNVKNIKFGENQFGSINVYPQVKIFLTKESIKLCETECSELTLPEGVEEPFEKRDKLMDLVKGLEVTYIGQTFENWDGSILPEKISKQFAKTINVAVSKGLVEDSCHLKPAVMNLAGDNGRAIILFFALTRYNMTFLEKQDLKNL